MKLGDQVDKKTIERAEKAEKERAKEARKVQEKADKAEKDRVKKATERERSRVFENVLSEAGKSRGCCESCNYRVKQRGEYQPCKLGHQDSGLNKEFCADCSESRYHPKNQF
jgi:phage-related minor tail protein